MTYVIPDPRWETKELLYPKRKPTGPVTIDWNNGLLRDLWFYFGAFNNTALLWHYDQVKPLDLSGSNYSPQVQQQGLSLVPSSFGSQFTVFTETYPGTPHNKTIFFLSRSDRDIDTEIIRAGGGGAPNGFIVYHPGFGGDFRIYHNSVNVCTSNNVSVRYAYHLVVFVIDKDNGSKVYVDGVDETATGGTFTEQTSDRANLTSGASLFGGISFAGIVNRCWSEEEVFSFCSSPYQFLIPK